MNMLPSGQSRRLSDPSSFSPHPFTFPEGCGVSASYLYSEFSLLVYNSLIPKTVMKVRMHCFLIGCIGYLALVSRGAMGKYLVQGGRVGRAG